MIATAGMALLAGNGAAAAQGNEAVYGVWSNAKGTLHVQTAACGEKLCGSVVWATDKAKTDSLKGGVTHLVGTQLLQEYRRTGTNSWAGRVFVPDMGRTFSSRIQRLPSGELKISGCLVGGLICKSQTWHRVP
ncbi:DUF2147 domain-containing protein [Sphingomonas aracearum]|uniref:DUF2147 domain-containing protein n=1 Tax=Sphingomonas aracearum TaxID=2283317 RepID=UPI001EF07CA2|nr:DUF2147 domain-containing protein [Sphingomonas aracearum]